MNYLEEAGKWLGLESDNIVDESVANFSIAFSARDLKYKNNMNEATYMNEGLFKKSKTIDPKIEPKAAISKAITLIKKYSKKYTDIKNISDAKYDILNQQKNKETFYTDFINNKEDQIDLIVYDIEAKYEDRNQIINLIDKQLIPDVNYELNKVGYSVEITDINGSEVIIDLVKGATINESYNEAIDLELVNEEKVFGVKIDKNKLNDEKYVKNLIKEINKESKKTRSILEQALIILSVVSILTIVGIPVGILLVFLTAKLAEIRYNIDTKDLKKIDDYLDKSIKKLYESYETASIKDRKKYEKIINQLENNRESIRTGINVSDDRKIELYKKKESNPYKDIINTYKIIDNRNIDKVINKNKQKIEKIVKDYFKSKKDTTIKFNYSKNGLTVYIEEPGDGDEYLLLMGLPKLSNKIKEYTTHYSSLANVCLFNNNIITYYAADDFGEYEKNINGENKYYGSGSLVFNFTYTEEDAKLTNIPASEVFKMINHWTVETEVSKGYVSLDDIKESEYEKLKNEIKYETTFYKNKAYIFNPKVINKISESYNFKTRGISMNTINKLVSLSESYNIKNSDRLRNDIVSEYTETINSLDSIDESVIAKDIRVLPVYKINEEEDFNDFLHKNYINEMVELKPVNEVLIADYDFVMSYNINFIERKMMPLSMLKRTKISFEKRLDNYETKLKEFKKMSDEEQKKVCRKINLGNGAYSTGMAVATTAVSNYASDGQYSLTYIEIPSTITPYNYPGVLDKMIKKMKYDIKKLDDIIKAKEKKKAMKESYAIDLDSLKYVVQNEHCTLEEAVQKIKDVNYIDDSYNISCVLPEGFNEQMTLDQFITLHNVLTEAGINLVWTKEVSENEFIQEAFSLENMRKN